MWDRYLWSSIALLAFAAPSPIIFGGWRLAVPSAAIILMFLATPQAVIDSYKTQLRHTDGRVIREQKMVLAVISEYPNTDCLTAVEYVFRYYLFVARVTNLVFNQR